jgi:hypothetical protein
VTTTRRDRGRPADSFSSATLPRLANRAIALSKLTLGFNHH